MANKFLGLEISSMRSHLENLKLKASHGRNSRTKEEIAQIDAEIEEYEHRIAELKAKFHKKNEPIKYKHHKGNDADYNIFTDNPLKVTASVLLCTKAYNKGVVNGAFCSVLAFLSMSLIESVFVPQYKARAEELTYNETVIEDIQITGNNTDIADES